MEEVYADVLFLVNFSMDFLCFYITSKILHRRAGVWRTLLSSALGGAYSVLVLFWTVKKPFAIIIDITVCILMNLIVFAGNKRFWLCPAVYFIISALLGGCMTAIYSLFNYGNLSDGQESDGMGTWLFFLLAIISGALTLTAGRFFRKTSSASRCRIEIELDGKCATADAFCDSGNILRDNLSGRMVILIDPEVACKIMPREVAEGLADGSFSDKTKGAEKFFTRIKPIPTQTANGGGLLFAVRPDKITVIAENGKSHEVDALIAPTKLDPAICADALMPSQLSV